MTKKEFELEAALRAMVALIPTNASTEWICETSRNTAHVLANIMFSEHHYLERYPEDTTISDIVSPESKRFCTYAYVIVQHGSRLVSILSNININTWGQLWQHYELYGYRIISRQAGMGKRIMNELKAIMEIQ